MRRPTLPPSRAETVCTQRNHNNKEELLVWGRGELCMLSAALSHASWLQLSPRPRETVFARLLASNRLPARPTYQLAWQHSTVFKASRSSSWNPSYSIWLLPTDPHFPRWTLYADSITRGSVGRPLSEGLGPNPLLICLCSLSRPGNKVSPKETYPTREEGTPF